MISPLRCLAALMIVAALPASADTLFSSRGKSDFSTKLGVLDGRAASQYAGSRKLQPEVKPGPERRVAAAPMRAYVGRYSGPWLQVARQMARKHSIPEDVFLRLVQRESGWNATAVSHKGAIGLAQLMPDTARLLKVNPRDPAQNLDGGARYLSQQFRRYGDWRLALAAYNAGPGAVDKYGGVPPYAETTAYVTAILGN